MAKKKKKSKWFDTSAFDDGYDFGDITKTIKKSAKKTSKTLQDNAEKSAKNKTESRKNYSTSNSSTKKRTRLNTQIGYQSPKKEDKVTEKPKEKKRKTTYSNPSTKKRSDVIPSRMSTQIGLKQDKKADNEFLDFLDKKTTTQPTKRTWFDKGALDDGYEFGDITKTVLGSGADLLENASAGIMGMGESAVDAFAWLAPAFNASQTVQYGGNFDINTYRQQQEWSKELIKKDLYDEKQIAKNIITKPAKKIGIDAENNSVFGEKSDSLVQSAGQLGGTFALQAMGVPWWLTTGTTSFGAEAENALNEGASYEAAGGSALISAGAEVFTEKLSGGIKFGGKTADDVLIKRLGEKVSNKTARTLAKLGIDATGEGGEEVLTSVIGNLGSALYKEESLEELLTSEEAMDEYIESFVGGAVLGGGVSGISAIKAKKSGRDYVTGLTEGEQKVIDREVEDRVQERIDKEISSRKKAKLDEAIKAEIEKKSEKFNLSAEQIEGIKADVRNSMTFDDIDTNVEITKRERNKIGDQVRQALERGEIDTFKIADTLYRDNALRMRDLKREKQTATPERQAEIDAELNALNDEFNGILEKNGMLQESYRQESLKSEKLDYKLDKNASDKAKKIVQSAVESGADNTRKTHEQVDFVIKMAESSDLDIAFTSDAELEQLGHYKDVEGLQEQLREAQNEAERDEIRKSIEDIKSKRTGVINGLADKGTRKILLNLDSKKLIEFTSGHEVTHFTEEMGSYDNLKTILKEYAVSKGEYQRRLDEAYINYYGQIKGKSKEQQDAFIEQEVTADLVGEYIFNDQEFISNLSAKEPNVFMKAYDYIKHLYKMATAGSDEARKLEQAKRMFDKAYKEMNKGVVKESESNSLVDADSNTKYSLSDSNGRELTKEQQEFFKDSKVRDDNGNLKVMYHGSENAGFHEFKVADDGISYFFTDNNTVAKSYSGTHDTYVARTFKTAEDLNNFFAEIGVADEYEVREEDGEFVFYDDGDAEATSDTAAGIYEEFRDWTGLGRGSANYEVYLDLKNPLIVDGNGDNWQSILIPKELQQDMWDFLDGRVASTNTRTYAEYAKDRGYDGVIFKNIYDSSIYATARERFETSTVAVVFDSNQIKSVANENPTADPDIRYSVSTEYNEFAKPRGGLGKTRLKTRKKLQTVRKIRSDAMLENGHTQADVDNVNRFMDDMANFMEEMGTTYRYIGLDDVNNAKIKVRRNAKGEPESIIMSAMVRNGEYPVNFDFSSICKKRQSMMKVIEELAGRKENSGKRKLDIINLTSENLWLINEKLREAGLETACLGCFVESKRYNVQAFADKAVKMWNDIVDEVRGDTNAPYFDFAQGVDTDNIDYRAVDNAFKGYVKVKDRTSPEKRMRALITSGEAYQRHLQPSDIMTPAGIEAIKSMSTNTNNFYGILQGVYGQAAPKEVMAFSPYNSEIALLPKYKGTGKNKQDMHSYLAEIGGVRMQSFSDFLIQNVYDYMQMVGDLAARRLPAHAYTKEISFAKIFGMTGIKTNLSLMFDIDSNLPDEYAGLQFVESQDGTDIYEGKRGTWEYIVGDAERSEKVYRETGYKPYVQSIGWNDAVALQNDPRYSANVGTIGVGYSDNHIRKMLSDNNVTYVIPYHSSSLPAFIKDVTKIKKATDYTESQNTRAFKGFTDANGKKAKYDMKAKYEELGSWNAVFEDIEAKTKQGWTLNASTSKALASVADFPLYERLNETQDPRTTANEYIAWCGEKGYLPVFSQFAGHENYYKLLFDFKVYDSVTGEYAPQMDVQNIYPEDVKAIIEQEMATQNEANIERDSKIPSIADEVLRHIEEKNGDDTVKSDVRFSLSDNDVAPVKPNKDAEFFKQTTKQNIDSFMEEKSKPSSNREPIYKEVSPTKKKRNGLGSAWDTFQTQFVNRNRQQDKLAKQANRPEIKFKGDRANNIAAEIGGDIFKAQTDNYGNAIGKALHSYFEPILEKGNGVYFNDYLMHLSNIERHAQGKGSKVSAQTSRDYVQAYETRFPEFKEAADGVHKYNVNQLNNAVENGLYGKDFVDHLMNMYGKYVPFYSAETETPNIDMSPDEIRSGRPIKRAIGGAGTTLQSVEQAMIKQTYAYMNAIAKNDLYKEIVQAYGGGGAKTIDLREGDSVKLEDFLYEDETGKYLTAFFNGEAKSVQISEELFTELKRDLDTQIKDIEEKYGIITKPLQWASKLRGQLLTTYNLGFVITNPIKDVQDALLNSKHTMRYIKNLPSAFIDRGKGKDADEYARLFKKHTGQDIHTVTNVKALDGTALGFYKDWKRGSTWNQFMTMYGNNATSIEYIEHSDNTDIDINKSAKKAKNKGFLNKLSNANNFMEVAFRYPEFKATLEKGKSVTEALYNAREVTTNFGRGGTISKAINRNGATFFNTSVQGMDKFFRNFSMENGAKGFMSTVAKSVILGMTPAMINHILLGGGYDDEYEALPEYVKSNYYLFRKGDGEFYRIPKGRMISVLGSAARLNLEASMGKVDPAIAKEVDNEEFLRNAMSQIGASNPLKENIFAPLIQAHNNEAWYGGDLVPTRLQKLPVAEQYDATTDEFSKWLGAKLAGTPFEVSPYKVNYVLDQYSGGIGDIVLPYYTPEATSGAEGPELAIAPIKDKFVVNSTDDNRYVGELFDLSDKLKVQTNSSEATLDDVLQYEYISDIASQMGELYALKREIQADETLSKAEKYAEVQKVQDLINDLATEGVQNYNSGASLDLAYEMNPDAVVSKVYDDYQTYNTYRKGMWDFKADKDENGKTIIGSKQDKIIDYLNETDLDYGERIILFKQQYPSNDLYNEDIIDYLNSRDDLYYEDVVVILESLGFTVRDDGTVEW